MQPIDIARKYRDKYGIEVPTLKLARILYNENKLSFKDVEAARTTLRRIEGKKGDKDYSKATHKTPNRPYNPYNLPDSDAKEYKPFNMPFYEKVGVMNDIHVPYHNIPAVTAAIDFLKKSEINALFLNGDVLDIHPLSYFERDPKAKRFNEELDTMKRLFEILQKELKCKIYFKFGNHEERYDKFLLQKAHELVGVEEFELENIVKRRFDCEVIRDKRLVIINGLPYVHGHEFGRGVFSPVNAARGLFNQAKHSAVKGDCHTTSEHTETDVMGKIMTTYSVGALCDLNPKWLPLNKWNHGVAVQHNSGKNKYLLENRRIFKGEII
jgi:predicted phosphodiesterase